MSTMNSAGHIGAGLAPLAVRPDNLTTLVFAAIRDKIVDATLAPGSSVSEASLAKQLEVSKTPVREALLRLRHVGWSNRLPGAEGNPAVGEGDS